jgi:uncharacterized protein (DUF58 family)
MSEIPILLILLLLIAVLLRLDFVFYLVYVLAGAYALARWRTARNLPALHIQRHFTDHAFLGEKVTVEMELQNRSWWPIPWLRVDETPPTELVIGGGVHQVVSLRPKERLRLCYELEGQRRGYYQIGPARLSTGDLFGFAEASGSFDTPDYLTVYPRVIPLPRLPLTSRSPQGTVRSRQPIFADPTRPIGVREYHVGDPLHSIDWKSSAHGGTLQVKKYEPAVSLTSIIFLDLNAEAYSRRLRYTASEWAIVVAASLANYLIGARQAVGLASNGLDPLTETRCWRIPPRPGRAHLMKLLEWLARVQLAEGYPLTGWLPTAALGLSWGTTAIVVTPTGDEAMCQELHHLLQRGLNPVLVVVEPYGQFGVVRQRARSLGITAHLVADERDLDRWCASP